VKTPRLISTVHQLNHLLPLGEDEVSYKLFTWVRSLKTRKGRFVENTSPLSENTKVEQYAVHQLNPSFPLGKDEVVGSISV